MAKLESFYDSDKPTNADFELIRGKPGERASFLSETVFHLLERRHVVGVFKGLLPRSGKVRFSELQPLGWDIDFEIDLIAHSMLAPAGDLSTVSVATSISATLPGTRGPFHAHMLDFGAEFPPIYFPAGPVYRVKPFKAGYGVYDEQDSLLVSTHTPWRDSDLGRNVVRQYQCHSSDVVVRNESLLVAVLSLVKHHPFDS